MINYAAILTRRYAGRQWSLDGDNYEGLTILDGGSKPTKKLLDDAWPEVQAEIAAEADAKAATRQTVLDKLGLTADEVAALFG